MQLRVALEVDISGPCRSLPSPRQLCHHEHLDSIPRSSFIVSTPQPSAANNHINRIILKPARVTSPHKKQTSQKCNKPRASPVQSAQASSAPQSPQPGPSPPPNPPSPPGRPRPPHPASRAKSKRSSKNSKNNRPEPSARRAPPPRPRTPRRRQRTPSPTRMARSTSLHSRLQTCRRAICWRS